MKKTCISFVLFLIIILSVFAIDYDAGARTEYLRIHIRADSNEAQAQAVKYEVKNAVVDYLTPFIAECDTKAKAEKIISENLSEIKSVAEKTLISRGFYYGAKVSVRSENFPTRSYGDFTLEQGYYDALIIELGSGKGDNWWCVVYPPLCFTGEGKGYVYRSKILDIINAFSKNKGG